MTRGRWHIMPSGLRVRRVLEDDGRTIYTMSAERNSRRGNGWRLTVKHGGRVIYATDAPTMADAYDIADAWAAPVRVAP